MNALANPQVGKFRYKDMAAVGSTSATITVPYVPEVVPNYYGVHLDLVYEVPCEPISLIDLAAEWIAVE